MLEEDEGTVMLRDDESTTILEADSMATTLLGDSEATTVLGAGEAARGGPYSERPLKGEFYPVLNCIVIHTEERI